MTDDALLTVYLHLLVALRLWRLHRQLDRVDRALDMLEATL